jgi:hypothetical protein
VGDGNVDVSVDGNVVGNVDGIVDDTVGDTVPGSTVVGSLPSGVTAGVWSGRAAEESGVERDGISLVVVPGVLSGSTGAVHPASARSPTTIDSV